MHDSTSHRTLAHFTSHLSRARRALICLDYDGTLAPFATDVREARPYAGVADVLDAIMATGRARLVIVSGRFLRGAPPILRMQAAPEIWGSHGRERQLADGSYSVAQIDEYALEALTIADGWSAEIEAAGGRCELKPGSIAFHWRGTGPTQMAAIRAIVWRNYERDALEDLLELRYFDGGIELRAAGPDKGDVVRTLIAETPADVPVAYLGDDLTDEDAFSALEGRGLGVLVRPQWRETAADAWVRPPEQLLGLLDDWRRALGS